MLHEMRWTSGKIGQRLALIESLVYRKKQPLQPFRYLELGGPLAAPPVQPEIDDGDWPLIPWQGFWGQPDTDFCLRCRFQISPDWPADAPVALYLPIGQAGDFSHPETLAYIDGQPYASCDRHHQEIQLPSRWRDGASHTLALHGWTGGTQSLRFAATGLRTEQPVFRLLMQPCAVVQIDQPTRDFIALARVALGVANELDENEPARASLYTALDEAFKVLDTREPFGDAFYASVPGAHETLQQGVSRAGAPLGVEITAAGHAHIDVAWLWTLGQTRRKAGRTFHNVLRLMEQFPEFHFTQSQPQLYDFVRQDYPELFEAMRQQVEAGRWEAIGGTWVEPDCNLSGGESLARQFLLGQTFYRQHLGEQACTPVLWLPDVFGYAWNLPQLAIEAGLKYFFTIKLGWSQYNRLPYDSFWWQGLDGSRILTHFSTTREGKDAFASTYNATASPGAVLNTWANFQQKDAGRPGEPPPLLMSYGYGDGGGGPTREMVENVREMGTFPVTPQVHCGTVAEFFATLEERAGDRLPTWNGELYLEYHRGTYTTQARNKRANRKSEFLLHDAEFLASLATTLDPAYAYPHEDLRRAWELVCLNQFHDIIPGSSIGAVYKESLQQYAEVQALGEGVQRQALASIAGHAGSDLPAARLLVTNPTSFLRRDLAFWPGGDLADLSLQRAGGAAVLSQPTKGGLLVHAGDLPPYSVTPLYLSPASDAQSSPALIPDLCVAPDFLENDLLRVELDANGDITRLYDKVHGREVLAPGALANQFQVFEDRPRVPDAWDMDIYYDDRMWLAEPASSIEVVESGPLRAALEVRRRVLGSEIVQRISLAHNSTRLDFGTWVQWRERHIMLKVAFPVDVLSPVATYEIQWGNVQRPTHRNTSWDWARFETCAQKWVDLSEGGYGVSLLNDCKYGHDIRDNVMRLTLLRSPTDPDPEADLGEHQFTYSLLPHAGSWDVCTVTQAYALNDPVLVWDAGAGTPPGTPGRDTQPESFVSVDRSNIVIETIKQAEDGQGLIVRLYESQRMRGDLTLTTGFPLQAAWRANVLEENQERLETTAHGLRCSIRPYQILTLRLIPALER